jgi:hypothetical protein
MAMAISTGDLRSMVRSSAIYPLENSDEGDSQVFVHNAERIIQFETDMNIDSTSHQP